MAKKDFSALLGKKNVQNETLPSNDDGQPVANLFAADYDKEAFAWRSCIKKKPPRYDRPSVQKGFSDVMSWQSHSS